VLALRDSRYLSVAVVGAWIFSPMVRRIVDWQSGEYVSVTALSILPMLATSALIIPIYPRLRLLPRKLVLPLLLIVTPVVVASAFGFFLYGASAGVEAGSWLLPILFLPYLATRPMGEAERLWMLRAMVLMAALAAAYGIYQYFVLPQWDRLWLVASQMTTSMGRPEPTQMRIWGPMNSTGPAAIIWALAIVVAVADRQWPAILRYTAIALLAVALCLTLVRIGWIIAVVGMIAYAGLRGGRDGIAVLITVLLCGAILCFAVQFLPHADTIIERASSFSDLANDNSYNERRLGTQAMFNEIIDRPWGRGMGFKTAAKLSGQTTMIAAVDNGYGDLIWTLGLMGGAAFLAGLVQISVSLFRRSAFNPGSTLGIIRLLAATVLLMVMLANCASLCILGISGVWCWFCIGLASAPLSRRE